MKPATRKQSAPGQVERRRALPGAGLAPENLSKLKGSEVVVKGFPKGKLEMNSGGWI